MVTFTCRTDDDSLRTPAEVKRMLHDIAFALRLTKKIKGQIISGKKPSVRSVSATLDGNSPATCAV